MTKRVFLETTDAEAAGSLFSGESLATFAGITTAVTIVWSVLKVVFADAAWIASPLATFLISILFGAFLFYRDISNPETKDQLTRRDIITKLVVGTVNCFVIAAAALGISTTTTGGG
jgi:hypothetical protein